MLLAAVLLSTVVACAPAGRSSSSPSPSGPPEVGILTISTSGCAYEGSSDPIPGQAAVIRLVDGRASGFNAYLWLLNYGYTFEDWAARFLVSHDTLDDHAQIVSTAHVEPNATSRLTAHFLGATYGILCVPLQDGQEYGVAYTAGPLDVPVPGSAV